MLEESKIVKLERHIPANGKNPNTDYEIIGLEDAISKSIENGPFELYFVSQINDILPRIKEYSKLDENCIIGEIVAFDDTTISFKPINISDAERFINYKVLFMYEVKSDDKEKTFEVESILIAYIQKESGEELELYRLSEEKEETSNTPEGTKCIELYDTIELEDCVVIEKTTE